MTTTDELIDGLVDAHMHSAPQLYRDDFRQALQVLVAIAQAEERRLLEAECSSLRWIH
jgi:hypothetical protein